VTIERMIEDDQVEAITEMTIKLATMSLLSLNFHDEIGESNLAREKKITPSTYPIAVTNRSESRFVKTAIVTKREELTEEETKIE